MPVVEARRENLPSILGDSSPFIPRSNINPLILLSCASDFAQIIKTSAIGEFVIQFFAPEIKYPPSTCFARVNIPPGSEP